MHAQDSYQASSVVMRNYIVDGNRVAADSVGQTTKPSSGAIRAEKESRVNVSERAEYNAPVQVYCEVVRFTPLFQSICRRNRRVRARCTCRRSASHPRPQ